MSRMLSSTGRSQADERRGQDLWDQHGRKFHASIEKKSGYPTGPIQLLVDAPLAPDDQLLGAVVVDNDLNMRYVMRVTHIKMLRDADWMDMVHNQTFSGCGNLRLVRDIRAT